MTSILQLPHPLNESKCPICLSEIFFIKIPDECFDDGELFKCSNCSSDKEIYISDFLLKNPKYLSEISLEPLRIYLQVEMRNSEYKRFHISHSLGKIDYYGVRQFNF